MGGSGRGVCAWLFRDLALRMGEIPLLLIVSHFRLVPRGFNVTPEALDRRLLRRNRVRAGDRYGKAIHVSESLQLGVYIDELLSYAFPNRTRFA